MSAGRACVAARPTMPVIREPTHAAFRESSSDIKCVVIVARSSARSIGLEAKSSQPAAMHRSRWVPIAYAVSAMIGRRCPAARSRLVSIHYRHLHIHEDHIERLCGVDRLLHHVQGQLTVLDDRHLRSGSLEVERDQPLIVRLIFGQEHASVERSRLGHRYRLGRCLACQAGAVDHGHAAKRPGVDGERKRAALIRVAGRLNVAAEHLGHTVESVMPGPPHPRSGLRAIANLCRAPYTASCPGHTSAHGLGRSEGAWQ